MTKGSSRSVPVNAFLHFLLKLSGTLCTAISYPFAYRMVGGDGIGKVAFATAIAGFCVMLASLGISTYGIRECARVREDKALLRQTVSELLRLQFMATLATEALLFLCVTTIPRLRMDWRLFLIQGGMLLFHGLDTEWLFSALERYDFLALRSFATKFLSVLLIIFFVRSPEDYLLYAAFVVVPTVLGNVWNILAARKTLGGLRGATQADSKKHLRSSLVFLVQAAAITVYTSLDAVLLGAFCLDATVGAYDAAVKIKLVLTFFVTSLGSVLLPRFSFYLADRREREFERGLGLSADFVLLAALPLMFFFLLMAPECLTVLYKEIQPETLSSLRILMPTLLLIGASNLTGMQVLTPKGRERTVMWSVIVGAGVDFVADLLLIPRWGAAGAAVGTVIAEAAVLAVQWAVVRRLKLHVLDIRWAGKILVAAAAGIVLLVFVRMLDLPVLLKVLLCAVCYFGAVYLALLALGEPVLKEAAMRLRRQIARTKENESMNADREHSSD